MTPQDTPPPLDLLPCPFCGGPAVIDSVGGPNTPFQVECTKCVATGHRAPYEKKAAAFWNRRAPQGVDQGNGVREATILEAMHTLAMLGLQSDRYLADGEFNEAVNVALHLAKQSKAPNPKAKDEK